MILEINSMTVIMFLFGVAFGFILGGLTFAIMIYFPDIKQLWSAIKFAYKFVKEKEKGGVDEIY